ncbi:MFS transporter [Streptomyces roseirectus]|uniref:MFS transporter n=1 Tax=Streptomyces roseirectus TaxID=2768066 RepID=A0A7H0IFY5_9ACTN|nr:MFS transporter [Streptomyces roseirectus]QNP71701.1 MFS transporter [Streptomyces roseirectus]
MSVGSPVSARGRGRGGVRGAAGEPVSPPGSRLLLPLIALCTAVTAANIYLAAPLLPLIARDFGTDASSVAWIASVAQFGYAAGLLFFAPLGDRVNRRRIVGVLAVVTAVALVGGALAGSAGVLAGAVFLASAATVVPQLLVPFVASRAPVERRARHVAAVIAGLFTGIVAARVVGGLAGEAFGWRWVFAGAAALTAGLGLVTAWALPRERPSRSSLFAGLLSMPSLVRRSPELWRACVRQAGMYGAWSALWTSLALLLTGVEGSGSDAGYGMSTATAGLFGLFGLAASVVAPLAGGLVDRFGAAHVVRGAYSVAAVSIPLFWWGGWALPSLFVAAVLIHAALVASHVANQTLALTTTSSPSVANSAYVVAGFAGGATASALAGVAYGAFGWGGVIGVAGVWLGVGWGVTAVRRR